MNKRMMVVLFSLMVLSFGVTKIDAEAATTIKNGTYNIVSALNNNKVIDIDGAKTANETSVQIWDCTDELQQQFKFTKVSGTYYKITDMNSGRVLDVA